METELADMFRSAENRGDQRGADAVFEAALAPPLEEHRGGSRAGLLAAVAAVSLIAVGIGVLANRTGNPDVRGPAAATNTWVDDFDNSPFDSGDYTWLTDAVDSSETTASNGRWGFTLAPKGGAFGGAVLGLSNRRFEPVDGNLVIEVDAAPARPELGPEAWHEVVVTDADDPQPEGGHGFMAADWFSGHDALGCRLAPDRNVTCELRDTAGETVWVSSWFQNAGTGVEGGLASGDFEDIFPECETGQDYSECDARFRFVISSTEIRLFIDDDLYFRQSGLPPLPNALIGEPASVWFGSMVAARDGTSRSYGWGRIAINP